MSILFLLALLVAIVLLCLAIEAWVHWATNPWTWEVARRWWVNFIFWLRY